MWLASTSPFQIFLEESMRMKHNKLVFKLSSYVIGFLKKYLSFLYAISSPMFLVTHKNAEYSHCDSDLDNSNVLPLQWRWEISVGIFTYIAFYTLASIFFKRKLKNILGNQKLNSIRMNNLEKFWNFGGNISFYKNNKKKMEEFDNIINYYEITIWEMTYHWGRFFLCWMHWQLDQFSFCSFIIWKHSILDNNL